MPVHARPVEPSPEGDSRGAALLYLRKACQPKREVTQYNGMDGDCGSAPAAEGSPWLRHLHLLLPPAPCCPDGATRPEKGAAAIAGRRRPPEGRASGNSYKCTAAPGGTGPPRAGRPAPRPGSAGAKQQIQFPLC